VGSRYGGKEDCELGLRHGKRVVLRFFLNEANDEHHGVTRTVLEIVIIIRMVLLWSPGRLESH